MNRNVFRHLLILLSFVGALFTFAEAAPADNNAVPVDKKLYVVGYAHLDTQWRWTYPQVVNQFLANTLHDNFPLIEKYPHYIFNFTGAKRYMLMKEYFPEDYERMKQYIAAGRWFPGGSNVDETDQNVPSAESVIRQVLYGNQFFRRKFNKAGVDFMVPDCFGFPASLPSVLAHCSIKGFSTQKLTWGSAVGIPFNVGVWEGINGQSVIAALNPGSYGSHIEGDLSQDPAWLQRIDNDGNTTGDYFDYRYYGTGDRGGAPEEKSIDWMEKSVTGTGPIHVISATSDQMFKDITPAQRAKLPRYKGELLLTWHSTGSLSSQAFMKRLNRKNELLADSAERASVAGALRGDAPYPSQKLYNAWLLLLEAQMHDILPGDCLPKAYEYSWNDEILASNQFAAVINDATGAVANQLNTQAKGISLVVYNPLAISRQDVVEATVVFPAQVPPAVTVIGPDGKAVPSQILSQDGSKLKILFLANVPSVSFSTFDVQPATTSPMAESVLKITNNSLENARYRVTLNAEGDVASIFDKSGGKQMLAAPIRLGFLHENPTQYPAWNMDWEDRRREPQSYVDGPAKIRMIETGPVRVALEVTRESRGSKFVQRIQLSAGDAGERVEFPTHIDWRSTECSLEAVMPLNVSNPLATYDIQVGTIQRGNNNPKKYEVPQQQWFDVTDHSGNYGVSVLNDSKYGSDKPSDNTVRLTLLYTPGVRAGYQDEGSQDFGRHDMVYALQGHNHDWREGRTVEQAARLNQPLAVFQSPSHPGSLGTSFSLISVDNRQVTIEAVKKAEDSDETIVRFKENAGSPVNQAQCSFASSIISAREVDGQEMQLGPATIRGGKLIVNLQPYALRAYALKLAPLPTTASPPVSDPIDLPFNLDAISTRENPKDGAFDSEGRTYPAEQLPREIISEGIQFKIGSTATGKKNAIACQGQTIQIPPSSTRIYLLAAAEGGDTKAQFKLADHPVEITVQDWNTPIGQWDNRLWKGRVSLLTYNWANRLDGLTPGFIKRDTVAWYADHRRHPEHGNEVYEYCYLFKYALDIPPGATTLTLPDNEHIRIFAITAAANVHDRLSPAHPLYDTLEDHVAGEAPTARVISSGNNAQGPFNDSITAELNPPLYWKDGNLRFTVDGTAPTLSSPLYTQPLRISAPTTIKAIEFDPTGKGGAMLEKTFEVNDVTAPTIKSMLGFAAQRELRIEFSEPVQQASAENADHYRFDPPLKVTAVHVSNDGTIVTLKLAGQPAAQYQLTIDGVRDESPAANAIKAALVSVEFLKPVFEVAALTATSEKPLEQVAPALPVGASQPWTINCFIKASARPRGNTIIAGFGNCDDTTDGQGRYLSWFPGGLHFWSRNQDLTSDTPLDIGQWQMLSAVYDGKLMTMYKNTLPIASAELTLTNDQSVVHLAPLDPWNHTRRFQGEIRSFTIWPRALTPQSLSALFESSPSN